MNAYIWFAALLVLSIVVAACVLALTVIVREAGKEDRWR